MTELSLGARTFLVSVLVAFNLFAALRIAPINTNLPTNRQHEHGDHDFRVDRVFRIARGRANRPFFSVANHFLTNRRNGGLFMFPAELFIRAGARRPTPIQVFSLAIFNLGLILFFLWVRRLTSSELTAGAGLLFLLTTPFLLYHCASIHQEAYSFLFFNGAMHSFTLWLERRQRRWLALTALAYFLGCQNYWMFYVSTWLMLFALQHRFRFFSFKTTALLSAVPVIAAAVVFGQVAVARGGAAAAWRHLEGMGAERSAAERTLDLDASIPTRSIYDEQAVMSEYPEVIADRTLRAMGLPLWAFGLLALATLLLDPRNAWRNHGWLLWVVAAGFSWNLIMIQHTAVHRFAGIFGWFANALVVGAFCQTFYDALRRDRRRAIFAACAIPAAAWLLMDPYLANLRVYMHNVL